MMKKRKSKKVKKAEARVKHCFDKIYDYFEARDFVEFRGTCGGDLLCFRVYDDGSICAR